jgi:Flp pilus assembly protein TadD
MLTQLTLAESNGSAQTLALHSSSAPLLPTVVDQATSDQLQRMFRDPRVLEGAERKDLITQLQAAVERLPNVPEVRVLYGMALCVDLQAQEALEQLRTASEQAPDCFIARLKYGELLMRLRVCDKAAEETHRAAVLATNGAQSEMARRQAATIRTMRREGVERGGYQSLIGRLFRSRRNSSEVEIVPALSGIE